MQRVSRERKKGQKRVAQLHPAQRLCTKYYCISVLRWELLTPETMEGPAVEPAYPTWEALAVGNVHDRNIGAATYDSCRNKYYCRPVPSEERIGQCIRPFNGLPPDGLECRTEI